MGILGWELRASPYAVVDVETTGLNIGRDRVVELSVLHVHPSTGAAPQVAFDSLVNPRRPVAGTHVHGITDAEVAAAPTFAELAGDLVHALSGCVVVGHNAPFDLRALRFELEQVGVTGDWPYVDTLPLRPALGLGGRACLDELRAEYRMPALPHHAAGFDAATAGCLLGHYLHVLGERRVATFRELAALPGCGFGESFTHDPLHASSLPRLQPSGRRLSRAERMGVRVGAAAPALEGAGQGERHVDYQAALVAALADLAVADEELDYLARVRDENVLSLADVRAIHARVFAWALAHDAGDGRVDDAERERIARLHACLSALGWAPGE